MNDLGSRYRICLRALLIFIVLLFAAVGAYAQRDPLPSWNDGPAKKAILSFVEETTEISSPKYVQLADRVATFDQDGTLWTEYPLYAQAMFALERVGQLAPQHPEWKEQQPFKAVLERDHEAMSKFTEQAWMEIVAATHAGMSTEEFRALVKQWLATAKAPRFDRPYTDLVYEPMLEVMKYLREKGFKTYIVTGGGQEFVRVYSEQVYGVPPEQVVGSSIVTKYEVTNGKPELMREPKPFLIDDGPGKAVGINLFIGKRPYAAFGNSGGDAEMLQWTQAGEGSRLIMLVLHDDATREYAYGPAGGATGYPCRHFFRCAHVSGEKQWLDCDQHEGRLEADLSFRKIVTKKRMAGPSC